MDINLNSNGERPSEKLTAAPTPVVEEKLFFEAELYPEKVKRAGGVNSVFLLLAGILITLFCVFGAMDINMYGQSTTRRTGMSRIQQIRWDSAPSAWRADEEIQRYAKNLQRFFIHYEGFDPDNINQITDVTEAEIRRLQMEHEIIYQRAAREVMDSYDERISAIEVSLNEQGVYGEKYEYDGEYGIIRNAGAYDEELQGDTAQGMTPVIAEAYGEYSRLIKERDNLIAGLAEQYLLTDDQAAKIIEQTRQADTVYDVSNYYDVKSYIENTDYLRYCIKRARDGEYITNIPEKDWAGFENPMQYVERGVEYSISVHDDFFYVNFNGKPLNEWFKSAGLSGYIIIPPTLEYNGNNPVSDYFNEKSEVRYLYNIFTMIVIVACLAATVIWGLFLKSGKENVRKAGAKLMRFYRWLPLTIKAIMFLAACALIIFQQKTLEGICYRVYSAGLISTTVFAALSLAAATLSVIYILLCLWHLWDIIRRPSLLFKEPEIRFVKRFFSDIALIYGQHVTSVSLSMTFLIMSYLMVQAMFFIVVMNWYLDGIFFIIGEAVINVLAFYVLGLITALAKTNKYMDAIICGNLDAEISEKGGYRAVINKLNRVRGGVRRVVVEKNKSEKMKADLITNVSHDLKTPLTSIINYIELLKSPQISEKEKKEYIDILDKKSQRVKLLIDDLFEATKLSSGQIILDRGAINIVSLLRQAVGELEEKFVSAGIMLKLTYSNESITVSADGKKLWRVFENLFTNMIKYSQPGTRAYVDISESGGTVFLIFKNISFYEMNFEYDELFERGRRGDAARSTEGSGLGLSIAKDIVELHGGTMEISIDGDLFKVVATLPAI